MAPIPPSLKAPGVRAATPGTIEWRPMIVNWFGSMFIAGLCAPLLVWLTIYCIRIRRTEAKKRAKAAEMSQTALTSNAVQVGPDLPPSVSGKVYLRPKVPKRVHLRRWFGWWTSSISSRDYERDPRVRINGNYAYTKREHFSRFFGWWSCSEESPIRDRSSHVTETDAESQRTSEVLTTSPGSQSEVENLQMQMLVSSPRELHPGRQSRARTFRRGSGKRGHPRSSQEVTTLVHLADHQVVIHQFNTHDDRGNAQQVDGLGEEDDNVQLGSQGQEETLHVYGSGSEENSGHWTVRKRIVGIAEACDWDNLRGEIRKSIHSQMLLPEEPPCDQLKVDASEVNQKPLATPQTPTELSPPVKSLRRSPCVSSQLRKVYSSPDLHLAYRRVFENDEHPRCNSISRQGVLHSNWAPVLRSFHTQSLGSIGIDTQVVAPAFTKTDVVSSKTHSTDMNTQDMRAISAAFSFDKTRRSTLDVVKQPLDADRQTLDDYEVEDGIDVEASGRNISSTTSSSAQCESSPQYDEVPGNTVDAEFDHHNHFNQATAWASDKQVDRVVTPSNRKRTHKRLFSSPAHTVNAISAGLGGHSEAEDGRFASLNTTTRRHSFPSTQKGIDIQSELDRKFRFCFGSVEKNVGPSDFETQYQALPCRKSKTPPLGPSGNEYLMIARTRDSKDGKLRSKKEVKDRKPTPFVIYDEHIPHTHKKRENLPKSWQTLSRLSEVQSLLSENDAPVRHSHGRNPLCGVSMTPNDHTTFQGSEYGSPRTPVSSQNAIYGPEGVELSTRCSSAIHLPRPVTPEKRFSNFSRSALSENKLEQRLSNRFKQDQAGVSHLTTVRTADRDASQTAVLTETQLRSSGSPVKRAFTNQSWAEKARRRESMRRAGRLLED